MASLQFVEYFGRLVRLRKRDRWFVEQCVGFIDGCIQDEGVY